MTPACGQARVSGDALTLDKKLYGSCGDVRIDALSGIAKWHAIKTAVDIDMVIEIGATHLPLGINIILRRKRR